MLEINKHILQKKTMVSTFFPVHCCKELVYLVTYVYFCWYLRSFLLWHLLCLSLFFVFFCASVLCLSNKLHLLSFSFQRSRRNVERRFARSKTVTRNFDANDVLPHPYPPTYFSIGTNSVQPSATKKL